MTTAPDPQLDPFEATLLDYLKKEVVVLEEARAATTVEASRTPPLRPSRRRRLTAIAAAAAGVLAASLAVHTVWPTPAYAVSRGTNGQITVKVMRLEGAEELESALAVHAIRADITYLPAGKECAGGRYQAVRTLGLRLSVASDWFKVEIPPGAMADTDTFVLSASVLPQQNGFQATVDFDVATGPVAPCEVIDSP